MANKLSFSGVGLQGHSIVGSVSFTADRIEWRDRSNVSVREFLKDDLDAIAFQLFGTKGHLKLSFKDGKSARLDGFGKSDFDQIAQYTTLNYNIETENQKVTAAWHSCSSCPHHLPAPTLQPPRNAHKHTPHKNNQEYFPFFPFLLMFFCSRVSCRWPAMAGTMVT